MPQRVALVVPTCRPERLREWLEAWEPQKFWDFLIVVESTPKPSPALPGATHFGLEDVDEYLGSASWIISRHDSARRSYGFLMAYRMGADLIYTLDDDCLPMPDGEDFADGHRRNLYLTPQWEPSTRLIRPRGMPYGPKGVLPDVMLSVGLWAGVPDVDAITQLGTEVPRGFRPEEGTRILPSGIYTPICGMNLAFRREFTPLAYFGLQGPPWPFARFDDIWFGLVAKKVCDHLGWRIAMGRPWVWHSRASDPYANLVKEAPGVGMHERLWPIIDRIRLHAKTPVDSMREVGEGLIATRDSYLSKLGEALGIWAALF